MLTDQWAKLSARVAALTVEERRRFIEKLDASNLDFAELPIVPASRGASAPASFAQSRQWFLWQLQPESTAYHVSYGMKLLGPLDEEALSAAFSGLVSRHESLRTIFRPSAEGGLQQCVRPFERFEIHRRDLSEEAREQVEARAAEEARSIAHTPFDLASGPLFRVGLIRMSAEEHVLVVVMHHIVSDGWSMQIIADEFVELYCSKIERREANLKALPIQYADYALWQRYWIEAGQLERQLAYWREQLGDEQPVLLLPTDRPRPAQARYRAEHCSFELPAALVDGLRQRAREHQATLFMVLLAGFNALLYRYTGQTDIRIGTTHAGRSRVETQGLVGFFVNTQVLRNLMNGQTRLGALVDQVRQTVIAAQEHQDLPFEQLVEALNPERSLSRSPLFQVMMNHQRRDFRVVKQLSGLKLERYGFGEQDALFELLLSTAEHAQGQVQVTFSFAAELFERSTVEAWSRSYARILGDIAEHPSRSIAEIAILSEADEQRRQERRNEYRGRQADSLVQLFERQVQRTPGAPAAIFGSDKVSYRALNGWVNRVARALIEMGVRLESAVGLALAPSLERIVGLLAILKAGGAYVPLDTQHPAERLVAMVKHSGVNVILGNAEIFDQFENVHRLTAEQIDAFAADTEMEHDLNVPITPDSLAYVIHTSGSTGQPKGVAMRHGPLVELIEWHGERLPGDFRTLHFASICFDVSFQELFTAVSTGGCIVIAAESERRDMNALVGLLQSKSIERLFLPFAVLQHFAEAAMAMEVRLPKLKQVITAGEQLKMVPALRAWLKAEPQCVLINQYGPTETHVVSDFIVPSLTELDLPPIGRAAAGAQLYVLDDDLNHVPDCVCGELYVGGTTLARGYLQKGALTAERFVADPYLQNGERLYRTGDWARWNRDGQLEYIGRADRQVKIRGFRIELGEVEAQLMALPGVREAVALVKERTEGPRLTAYVVGAEQCELVPTVLRQGLSEVLPDYMIPTHIVVLSELPRNANGKVNRRALPEPEHLESAPYEAPQGTAERLLAHIWSEVLGVERIGRHDNFFELGGHSLLMTRVLTRVRERTELLGHLKLVDMMQQPTISGLLHRNHSWTLSNPLIRLNAPGHFPPLFCIHPAGGAVFCYFPLAQALNERRTVYGIACRSFVDFSHRDVSALQMAQDYAALIRKQQPAGPYLLLGHSSGGLLASLIAHLLEAEGCTVDFLGLVDTFVPTAGQPPLADTLADLIEYIHGFLPDAALDHTFLAGVDLGPTEDMRSNAPVIEAVKQLVRKEQRTSLEMSAEEIVDGYIINRRMRRITVAAPPLPALQVAPHCWWRKDRPVASCASFRQQVGQPAMECEINADHATIISSADFVAHGARVLSSF